MSFEISIANYRNISIEDPLSLAIENDITFLLGVNNSGKSNFLRALYELRGVLSFLSKTVEHGVHNFNLVLNGEVNFEQIRNQSSNIDEIYLSIKLSNASVEYLIKPLNGNINENSVSVSAKVECTENKGTREWSGAIGKLREALSYISNTLYIGPHRISTGQVTASHYDTQIGSNFISTWDGWANGPEIKKRKKINVLESELKDLFQFKKFSISVSSDSRHLIISNDDGSFKLEELGTGIGHFILVLGNALIRESSIILIDEPENSLHPQLQEAFIRALASKCAFGLIATSHNLGLAKSVADRIYMLQKNKEGNIYIEGYSDETTSNYTYALGEMHYSQFAAYGISNILLVEGLSDIKVFKEILAKYSIERRFIILSLAGSNYIKGDGEKIKEDLANIKSLNPKSISVIIDSNRTTPDADLEPAIGTFKRICEELNFNIFATDYHSTENYITQDAINTVLGANYRALGPFDNFKAHGTKWSKSKNWLMFREIPKEIIDQTQLGKFIREKLVPLV